MPSEVWKKEKEIRPGDKIKIWGSNDYDTLMDRLGSITGTVIKFVDDFKSPYSMEVCIPAAIIELDNIIEHEGNEIKYIAISLTYEGVTWEGEYEPGRQTIGIYSISRIPCTSLDELSKKEVMSLETRSFFEIY